MLAFFSVVPVGVGVSVGKHVAEAVEIIADSDLDYQLTAMGTLIEGDWNDVMTVIRKCVDAMHEHSERVTCLIKVDDHRGKSGLIDAKVASVEGALGFEVNT